MFFSWLGGGSRLHTDTDNQLLPALIELSTEAIVVTDHAQNITVFNHVAEHLFGYEFAEVRGKPLSVLLPPEYQKKHVKYVEEFLAKPQPFRHMHQRGEVMGQRKDGEAFLAEVSIARFEDDGKACSLAIVHDVSERKLLENSALYDSLTHLPGHQLLLDRMQHAFEHTKRNGWKVALVIVAVDQFRGINDMYGYQGGDQLLLQIAQRLRSFLRREDTLGRLAGDEFLVVMEGLKLSQEAAVLAEKLLGAFARPFMVNGHDIYAKARVGISVYPDHGEEPGQLVSNAGMAISQIKTGGINAYGFYHPRLTELAVERSKLESELRLAMERNELSVHYQPQVSLQTGKVVGVEALIRWIDHPELGCVPPDRFVPIAERSGLIIPLGEWVLDVACRQMASWLDAGYDLKRVAVNVSGVQMQRTDVVAMVRNTLEASGLPPSHLELEITESYTMYEPEQVVMLLQSLRDLGVELAIDDFGTGYSSLSYLQKYPIQRLKIDQSFVQAATHDPNSAEIVRAVIAMARAMQLQTTAEGVENKTQQNFLREEECDEAQGYLFGKPVSAEEITKFFDRVS